MMLLVGSGGIFLEKQLFLLLFVHLYMNAVHLEASKGMPDD
jgi:hypothetical protein